MYSGLRFASMAAASALIVSLTPASAVAAESCASRSEVRAQIGDLVHDLRDDVRSRSTRSTIARSLVETLRTIRGEHADTAAERRAIGEEMARRARELRNTEEKAKGRALRLWLEDLREQRERGALTAEERDELRGAVEALKQALVERTDTRAEDRAVSADVRRLQADFACPR